MDMAQLDNATPVIAAIALVIAVVVVVWILFRRNKGHLQVGIKGPGGTEASIKASTQSPPITPAVNITDAESEAGNLRAQDGTGRGANVQRVKVKGDIEAASTLPEHTPPKA